MTIASRMYKSSGGPPISNSKGQEGVTMYGTTAISIPKIPCPPRFGGRVRSRLRVGVGIRVKVGFKDNVGVQSGQNGQGE